MEALYISYDGLLEPLGQSQVVSYLFGLAPRYCVTVISYEKGVDLEDKRRVTVLEERLRSSGIRWIRLRYHKSPTLLATFFDVLVGVAAALRVTMSRQIGLVHARGYVASMIAIWVKRLRSVKFIFDMRGFWADEKVDSGNWSRKSLAYLLAKRWERVFFERADAIVSLTEEGVRMFPDLGYQIHRDTSVEVIPTCADLERFSPGPKDTKLAARLNLEGGVVIGSVGTLSNWYLRKPTLEFLAHLVKKFDEAKVLFVTREDHTLLRADALQAGIPPGKMVFTQAEFSVMPSFLRLMDLGVFFIKVCFSKKGSAATKLGEFLATGVPVVINDGIGDSGKIVREHNIGVTLSEIGPGSFRASLKDVERLLKDRSVRGRCVAVAQRYFDLEQGVAKYAALYDRMMKVQGG